MKEQGKLLNSCESKLYYDLQYFLQVFCLIVIPVFKTNSYLCSVRRPQQVVLPHSRLLVPPRRNPLCRLTHRGGGHDLVLFTCFDTIISSLTAPKSVFFCVTNVLTVAAKGGRKEEERTENEGGRKEGKGEIPIIERNGIDRNCLLHRLLRKKIPQKLVD